MSVNNPKISTLSDARIAGIFNESLKKIPQLRNAHTPSVVTQHLAHEVVKMVKDMNLNLTVISEQIETAIQLTLENQGLIDLQDREMAKKQLDAIVSLMWKHTACLLSNPQGNLASAQRETVASITEHRIRLLDIDSAK